ncbi:DNA methyltransferase, partial [Xanthobacter autotrophicus]
GDDELPEPSPFAVSRRGDIWQLGDHRLACGDARDEGVYRALMSSSRGAVELAQMVFTDPPYNVRIRGNVSSSNGHREFVMASGEMSQDTFVTFLTSAFRHMAAWSEDGSIHFVCMDWRHMVEINVAGREVFSELKNLIVWAKDNAG